MTETDNGVARRRTDVRPCARIGAGAAAATAAIWSSDYWANKGDVKLFSVVSEASRRRWRQKRITLRSLSCRFWPLADIDRRAQCPLLGVKRTWRLHCEMSAFVGGIIVNPHALTWANEALIIALTLQHRVLSPLRNCRVREGGGDSSATVTTTKM